MRASLYRINQFAAFSTLLLTANASSIIGRNTTQQWAFDQIPPTMNLVWYPCLDTYFCAMLDVPLDYSIPNGTRAAVPLIKIAAQDNSPNGTYQGMLLINPGGPGEAGVDFILNSGTSILLPVIGSNFDIVSFDPRGMGRSIPRANCSQPASQNGLRRRAFGLHGPELPQVFFEQVFQSAQELGQECEAAIGGPDGAGPHMSTPVVATDMLSIVDAFAATESGKSVENSSLLNYWGFSYGTFIGETFASLYPDRVGRVAIDGVADPEDYSTGADLSDIPDDDAIIDAFFIYCNLAGPTLCPFSTGTSAQDIQTRFENLFLPLNASYAISQNWTNATTIAESLATIKKTLRLNTYSPITLFPAMALQLVAFEQALTNLTYEAVEAASNLGVVNVDIPGTVTELQEWLPGVVCSDSPSFYNQTYADLETYIGGLEQQSFVGGENWAEIKVLCSGWPIKAAWRFAGPFGGDTKNPILFVSNTIDPATPIQDSQKWAPSFTGSQILEIEAIGHTSMAAGNACANEKIFKFFQTGELPGIVGNNTVCALEKGPFGIQLQSLNLADLNATFSSSANSTTQPLANSTVGGRTTATSTPVQGNGSARVVIVNVDGFVTIIISFLVVVFSL